MSTAEQDALEIIAEALREEAKRAGESAICNEFSSWSSADGLAAHVVAALTNAGHEIVDPKAFDLAIWLHLGGECDDAPEPNYEEDNYDAGFIAGIAHAQKTIRAQLPELLAAARVAEGGERGEATS